MTLVETGTRALLGAAFGSTATGEADWARQLLHLLDKTMLVLMDRGFDGGDFLAEVAGTGAQFLVRLNASRRPPVLRCLPDGSFTSVIGGVKVRVIAAEVTVSCHDGTSYGGWYRLATTDALSWPASTRPDGPASAPAGLSHPSAAGTSTRPASRPPARRSPRSPAGPSPQTTSA
jgi:hypothetical protein